LAIVRSPLQRSWYTKSISDCRSILSRSDVLQTITACNRLCVCVCRLQTTEKYITPPDTAYVYSFLCQNAIFSHNPVPTIWHCMKKWSESLYLDSPAGSTGRVSSWLVGCKQLHRNTTVGCVLLNEQKHCSSQDTCTTPQH
jgi:hypothetical protein